LKGHKGDFPQGRLKTGSGEQCLWVLDRLADEALKAKSFAWKRLVVLTLFSNLCSVCSSHLMHMHYAVCLSLTKFEVTTL